MHVFPILVVVLIYISSRLRELCFAFLPLKSTLYLVNCIHIHILYSFPLQIVILQTVFLSISCKLYSFSLQTVPILLANCHLANHHLANCTHSSCKLLSCKLYPFILQTVILQTIILHTVILQTIN